MSFGIWQRTITDETGNVLPASEIEVREPSVDFTGDIVELFSNETGTAGNANPFTADSEGFAQFYAAPRKVDIRATGAGSQRTWRNVEILGAAAIADTGTAAGEVPLNSDLPDFGTAAIADVQTSRTDVATGKLATFPFAYSQGNILGTVSQSGGVPTGAIIERGSNSNGEYVKFADGTFLAWGLRIFESLGTIEGGEYFFPFKNNSYVFKENLPVDDVWNSPRISINSIIGDQTTDGTGTAGGRTYIYWEAALDRIFYTNRARNSGLIPSSRTYRLESESDSIGGTSIQSTLVDWTAVGRWY